MAAPPKPLELAEASRGRHSVAIGDGNKVSLLSRNGNDFSDRFPAVAKGLGQLKPKQFVLDGEVVALDDEGRPSFQRLQNAHRRGSGNHAYFYAFDLLNLGGRDLTGLPIEERKRLFKSTLTKAPARLRLSSLLEGEPTTLIAAVRAHGLEGLVANASGHVTNPANAPAPG